MNPISRAALAQYLEHTLLKPDATADDIRRACAFAARANVAVMMVAPCWAPLTAAELKGSATRLGAVDSFPHGCDLPFVKAQQAACLADVGAHEIDMVLNRGFLRSGHPEWVRGEIEAVVKAAPKCRVKVILETSELDESLIRTACSLAEQAGAHYVKTSTGYGSGGATPEAVRLLRACVGNRLGVKASGGIRTFEQALAMIEAGASRIGTSSTAAILAQAPDM